MKRKRKDLMKSSAEELDTMLWRLLPHDVVELILECVAVKPLLRFRSVSKKWKSTIDSPGFKERHLIRRRQVRVGPDVLTMRLSYDEPVNQEGRGRKRWLAIPGSSSSKRRRMIAWHVNFTCSMFCSGSCDGLVCIYCLYPDSIVANPSTGWYRSFPLSNYQDLLIQRLRRDRSDFPWPSLGFGRDKLSGTFKPVWLYNSSGFVLGGGADDVVTYCEVFDFSTNAWRYVVPASPHPINAYHKPVHLDGSLYWFTDCEQPMVLSFDLHTETFQVICKPPFAHPCDPRHITMCILDNRLCVSEKKELTQVIWSFDFSDKTWTTLCSFDLNPTFSWFRESVVDFPLLPIAILDKGQLLLHGRGSTDPLVIHDLHTKSYDLLSRPRKPSGSVYYFESLLSAFSN